MRNRKLFVNVFSVAAFVMIAYSLSVYVYLQSVLNADMQELTVQIKTIGNLIIPALFIVGLYHLYLLAHAMQILTGRIKNSVLFVILILSSVMLFADLGLLSEMGKEYLYFDISTDWTLLYCLAALHILAMVWGLTVLKKTPKSDMKFLEAFNKSSDALFLSVHQISFISGILGVCAIFFAKTGVIVDNRFSEMFMILLAGLSLVPLALIIIYWILKMRKKPVKEWMDEKQMSDTALGGLISFLSAILLYILIVIFDFLNVFVEPASFWLLLIFFVQLIVFSALIMERNKNEK